MKCIPMGFRHLQGEDLAIVLGPAATTVKQVGAGATVGEAMKTHHKHLTETAATVLLKKLGAASCQDLLPSPRAGRDLLLQDQRPLWAVHLRGLHL